MPVTFGPRRRGGRPPRTAERATDVAASGTPGGMGNGGEGHWRVGKIVEEWNLTGFSQQIW